MFKHYRNLKARERSWIRNHPVQYVALNVTVFVVFLGYAEYKDRKEMRKLGIETPQHEN